MKIIRQHTFETNSSSSHALVIGARKVSSADYFPKDSDFVYVLGEYGVARGDDYKINISKMHSEVDKARFMLNIITTHIDEDEECEEYPDVSYWLDWDNKIVNPNRSFETLIAQEPFVWFKELLEERTGTQFEFEKPKDDEYPYYETVWPDEGDMEELTGIDWHDEKKFKARVAEIVFNPDIVIADAHLPYCCDFDIDDL